MGNVFLLMMITVGMSAENPCGVYLYPHPHNDKCLHCRICPDDVVADEEIFRQQREPGCGNNTLPDGRKVQCGARDYERPTCPALTPQVGDLVCEDNSTVYTSCRLTCPRGYLVTNELNLTCLPTPHLHWDHQLPVCIACPALTPQVGDLVCEDNSTVYTSCRLTCPRGYLVTNELNLTCLPTPHLHWDHQLPVCIATTPDKGKDFPLKHAHKVLSVTAIAFICLLCLFSWVALIILIQWKKRKDHMQRKRQQESQNAPQPVKIHLKNAKKSQRCYVLKDHWIAKTGEDVTVTGEVVSGQIESLIVIKEDKKETDPPVYSSLPTAPNEIVLHSVRSKHKGWYNWMASLSNNTKPPSGRFNLDVRQTLSDRLIYSRSCSQENGYVELQEEDDPDIRPMKAAGFDSLLKNTKDVKRLSVLFDQDRQQGRMTWHNIATSPLINFDMQQVHNEEYNFKIKSKASPTFQMLSILHQRGTSVKDLRDFLLTHLISTAEAIQILDKYL